MAQYASKTEVPVDRSRTELEGLLTKYDATQFAYAWQNGEGEAPLVAIAFTIRRLVVRIELPMPSFTDPKIEKTPSGKRRTVLQRDEAYAQETRRRWRCLVAIVKAKLVAVEDGISTLEREFLADVVLPNGSTVGEWAVPQLGEADMPALLPGKTR
jgi:hypothetical protein